VLGRELARHVPLGGAAPRHRRHHQAVAQLVRAELEVGEEVLALRSAAHASSSCPIVNQNRISYGYGYGYNRSAACVARRSYATPSAWANVEASSSAYCASGISSVSPQHSPPARSMTW